MLHTRFTPDGVQKKHALTAQQKAALLVSACVLLGFCCFGLPYMTTSNVVQAQPASGERPSSATPAPSAAPTTSADAAAPAATPAPEEMQATAAPTPFAPILQSDADNGKWLYETDQLRLSITRETPLDNVVATVAILKNKTDAPILRTAFADGAYGKNVRARTREIAASVDAVFAINGDYCGYRTDGIIVREGVLYRNEPAREMMCLFSDGRLTVQAEKDADMDALLADGLTDTWSFGPILVKDGQLPAHFNTDVKGQNPRTAVGQTEQGDMVFVVVDGRLPGYSDGMTIQELAQYMSDLGCVNAYNLDGGMTSCMYFDGKVISTPCGTAYKERSLSDIVYVGK